MYLNSPSSHTWWETAVVAAILCAAVATVYGGLFLGIMFVMEGQ